MPEARGWRSLSQSNGFYGQAVGIPRVDQLQSQSLKVTNVARRKGKPVCGGDTANL